jgi:hypothetical protein
MRAGRPPFCLGAALVGLGVLAHAAPCRAAPATLPLEVGGIRADVMVDDVLGIGRVRFVGLIAEQLQDQGYRVVAGPLGTSKAGGEQPLTLVGVVKEELCERIDVRQCRIAVQWELQDQRGATRYRVTTRAVGEGNEIGPLQRGLVLGALQSLLARRRFALQLRDFAAQGAPPVHAEQLGFKACSRRDLELPKAFRSVSPAIVLVESGSNIERGSIVSPDGFVLTGARALDEKAPLRVKLGAGQTLPARLVAVDGDAHLALLQMAGSYAATCLPLRSETLGVNAAVFGVNSPLSEDRATSLAGSVVQSSVEGSAMSTDPRLTQSDGAPLLDDAGQLAAVVGDSDAERGQAVAVTSALAGLHVKPAAVTDPRLLAAARAEVRSAYVRDRDDPPYSLTQRYTYGTSAAARGWRRVGIAASAVGAAAVILTWASSHGADSQGAYDRWIVANDISWGVLAVGAVTTGVSFFLPESHDVVDAQMTSAAPRAWRIGLTAGGAGLSGRF